MSDWTKPYFGVTHLVCPALRSRGIRQLTITEYGEWAEIKAIPMEGFTSIWEDDFKSVAEAKAAGERRYLLES